MKISIINGSPKLGKSTSGLMIEYLISQIPDNKIEVYNINKTLLTEAQLSKIANSDALIFAFPLYIDSIPSHLLRLLEKLEKQHYFDKKVMVYCIINNGFYEGKQTHVAVSQMKLWCRSAKLTWGQALGTGAGEMLPFITDIPLGHGPNKNIGYALEELSHNIITLGSGNDLFVSPNWPRFLWKIMSSLFFWYPLAKANGLKRKDMLNGR